VVYHVGVNDPKPEMFAKVIECPEVIEQSDFRILPFGLLSPLGSVAVPVSHIGEVHSPAYDLWKRNLYEMAIGVGPMSWAMCPSTLFHGE